MNNEFKIDRFDGGRDGGRRGFGGAIDVAMRGAGYSGNSNIDADKILADVYRKQLNAFNQYQMPQIKALEDELNDTSIIDDAYRRSDALAGRVNASTSRLLSTNAGSLLPSQKRAMQRDANRAIAKGRGSMITGANEAQRAKRVAVRQDLMRIGEQLTNTGTASLSQVAQSQAQRDAANRAAKKGALANTLAIAGAVVGGIAGGGPAGAQAGAAIGGAAGNMFG